MKKLFRMCGLIVLSAVMLCGCNKKSVPIHEYGQIVADRLGELSNSDDFWEVMGISKYLDRSDFAVDIHDAKYKKVDKIYIIRYDKIMDCAKESDFDNLDIDLDDISDLVRDEMNKRGIITGSIMFDFDVYSSYDLAVLSSLRTTYTFVDKKIMDEYAKTENISCLYCYKDAYPILVSFSFSENGVFTGDASFVPINDFDYSSAKKVKETIKEAIKVNMDIDRHFEVEEVE